MYVVCHTGGDVIDVCLHFHMVLLQTMAANTIRDLKYKGTTYCLTRLRFELNVTPKIMAAVLKTVLKQEEK